MPKRKQIVSNETKDPRLEAMLKQVEEQFHREQKEKALAQEAASINPESIRYVVHIFNSPKQGSDNWYKVENQFSEHRHMLWEREVEAGIHVMIDAENGDRYLCHEMYRTWIPNLERAKTDESGEEE